MMRILIITDYVPYPLHSGDKIRVFNLVKQLSREHEVTLCSLSRLGESQEAVQHLRSFCKRVETGIIQQQGKLAHIPGLIKFALTGRPLELKFLDSPELFRKIAEVTKETQFDIIQIEHSRMAFYREAISKSQRAKLILMFHNVIFSQGESILKITQGLTAKIRAWIYSKQMRIWEPRYAQHFDRCITVSELDAKLLQAANPSLEVAIIPNGVDTVELSQLPIQVQKPALLFIGSMGYPPVADAAIYFCQYILPLIKEKIPDIDLWLVGREPPACVMDLGSEHVHVTGPVENIIEYYKKCTISVVPLRAGGGTRLKILEALSLGIPVVTTSIGCEGLDVIDQKHLLIANTPELFSDQVIRLLDNKKLVEQITAEGRKLVVEKYDWRKLTSDLENIYEGVLSCSSSVEGE